MDLPLIGTVDLTPSGLFLIFAVLLAVGYVVWRVVEARRKGSGVNSEKTAQKGGADEDSAPEGDEPHAS
jgi:hypothetical protein